MKIVTRLFGFIAMGTLLAAAPVKLDVSKLASGDNPIIPSTVCAQCTCGYSPSGNCGIITKSKCYPH